MNWTHPICDKCWNKRHPNRPPYKVNFGTNEVCCFCQSTTNDGIYVREDPTTVPCKGVHDEHRA